jgi:hypothetical protein
LHVPDGTFTNFHSSKNWGTFRLPAVSAIVVADRKIDSKGELFLFQFLISHEIVLRRIKSCPSTQSINGFGSGRRNHPWSRVAGYSTPRPQAQHSRKGFVHGLLGKIKITEQAEQSR